MHYRFSAEPDDNGTWLITAPDFPEATTFSEPDIEHARIRAVEAIETAIQGRITDRREIPESGPAGDDDQVYVSLPTSTALKIRLHRAMLAHGVRKAELARRLGWHPPQVDRLSVSSTKRGLISSIWPSVPWAAKSR